MKKILLYTAAMLALLFTSCAKSVDVNPAGDGVGAVSFRIFSETTTDAYNPMDHCKIRIYSADGLIRKYFSEEDMPSELQLIAGTYTIKVDLGDQSIATWTNKSYYGETEFTVTAGESVNVDVVCKLMNAIVEVNYDESVAENLTNFQTKVSLYGESLIFTESGMGYLLPDGDEAAFAWNFTATDAEHGTLNHSGEQAIKAGGKYILNFAYSPDAVGYLVFTIELVEPEECDDLIIFSPEPVFKGKDFSLEETQKFYNTTRTVSVSSPSDLKALTIEMEGTTYDLVNDTVAGVTVTKNDSKNWDITLADAFVSALTGGDHALVFVAEDVDGGRGKTTLTLSTQGIVPTTEADYNLWTNTGSIRVKVYDTSVSSVAVKMRRANGEWSTYTATKSDDDTYTAVVSPTWTEVKNAVGDTAYRPDAATGIYANATYETMAVIGGEEKAAVATFTTSVNQPIPNADFEDSSLACFSTKVSTAPFWGSGNNSMKKELCVQVSKSGQGGSYCVKMETTETAGFLAAGNLFTGTFDFDLMSMGGTVNFGVNYDWKARPSAIRLKYHAKVGLTNVTKHKDETGNYPLENGEQDMARVYALIVDWSSRPAVRSGSSAPTGCFDPEGTKSLAAGNIIGYAVLTIDESTAGDSLVSVDVPFHFYDKTAKPTGAYKLVISASANAYGDYMCGCNDNVLYVDDFEWVY